VSDARVPRRNLVLADVDERRTTYLLPDVDGRCLNCSRPYSRHHGSRCYPCAVDELAPATARRGRSSFARQGRLVGRPTSSPGASRRRAEADQLELPL
jgi:hypothetical protein